MKEITNFATRITPLWQRDPRWRDVPMGSRSQMTIGNNGCLMTAITMITNAMGRTRDLMPDEVLTHFHRWRAVDPFSGMMPLNGLGITRAYPDALVYKGFRTNPSDIQSYLNMRLSVGAPVLARVDTTAPTDHWVVIVGNRGGYYIAADPLYGDVVSVTGRYKNTILEVLDVRPVSYQGYPMAIDVSKYNSISFDGYSALKDRFAYAIVKASEGGGADPMYSTHVAHLSVPSSPYHYLRPESHTPILKQLEIFRSVIDDFPRTHISWIDYEGNHPVPTAVDLERFINAYEQAVGEKIGIYSTGHLLRSVPEKLLRGRPIWQAHYGVQQPDTLPYSMKPAVWQFYDHGRVLGSDSNTDLNYVVGPLDDLLIRPKQIAVKETIDLMPYIRPIGNVNGRPYMIQMGDGRQERYQYQPHPSDERGWYIVKNGQWEQWRVDQNGVVRLVRDTSPEPHGHIPCYYEVTAHDGTSGGMMFPKRMAVGETYTEPNNHRVVFRDKRSGAEYGDPRTGYNHNETTLFSCDGETIRIGKSGGEIHTYRKGMGRIGWESPWGTAHLSIDDAGGYANDREHIA